MCVRRCSCVLVFLREATREYNSSTFDVGNKKKSARRRSALRFLVVQPLLALAILPLAPPATSICGIARAFAMLLAFLPLANILAAVRPRKRAASVHPITDPLAVELALVAPLAFAFAVLKL